MATVISRLLTVYDHPLDHPEYYVARWWDILEDSVLRPEQRAYLFKDLDTLRAWIQQEWPWLHRLERFPNDDPNILEVWL